jgi:surface protein
MSRMFEGNSVFNVNISNWNVSNVRRMSYMFYDAPRFNHDISHWPLHRNTYQTLAPRQWVAKAMTQAVRDQLMSQTSTCPVTLVTITDIAVQCLICKHLFNEKVKDSWITSSWTCPHCRSPWKDTIYYRVNEAEVL